MEEDEELLLDEVELELDEEDELEDDEELDEDDELLLDGAVPLQEPLKQSPVAPKPMTPLQCMISEKPPPPHEPS